MAESPVEITRGIARLISRSNASDIPPEAFHQARRSAATRLANSLALLNKRGAEEG